MKKINLNETALLIIHFQNDFCHKNALESKGKNADVVAKNINNLVDFFDGKIQIIFSKARYDKKYLSEFQVIDGLDELEYPCREGTWGAEYFKLKLPKNYVEINSSRNDSFAKTFLEKILKSKKIKNLIIVGATTEICIAASVMSADSRGYNVIVPRDCIFSPNSIIHDIFVKVFEDNFAFVTSLKELVLLEINN